MAGVLYELVPATCVIFRLRAFKQHIRRIASHSHVSPCDPINKGNASVKGIRKSELCVARYRQCICDICIPWAGGETKNEDRSGFQTTISNVLVTIPRFVLLDSWYYSTSILSGGLGWYWMWFREKTQISRTVRSTLVLCLVNVGLIGDQKALFSNPSYGVLFLTLKYVLRHGYGSWETELARLSFTAIYITWRPVIFCDFRPPLLSLKKALKVG